MINKIKQNAKYVCLVLVFITLTSLFFGTVVTAEEFTSLADVDAYADEALENPIKIGVYEMTKWCRVGPAAIADFAGDLFKTPDWNLLTVFSAIYGGISSIGKLLCFLYFLLEIMEHATRDTFTLESFVKLFSKLIIMFVIFDPDNMEILMNFGADLNNSLVEVLEEGLNPYADLKEYVDEIEATSWIKSIGYLFTGIFPSLGMLLGIGVALCICAGRIIELAIYNIFLPIGISSIYNGGLNSSGFRYLKKVIALNLQGAVIYAVLFASSSTTILESDTISSIPVIGPIIVVIASIAIIARSKSIANDIVGV